MANDGKSGIGATLVVPLLVAILSAGSAPWWWSHVSGAAGPPTSAEARMQPTSPQLMPVPAQVAGPTPSPTPAPVEQVAAPAPAPAPVEPVFAGLARLLDAKDRYQARLSSADHCNSRGELLGTAAQIIRQDRANFYLKKGDREDSPMDELSTADARQGLEARVLVDAETARVIKASTPLVEVEKTDAGFTVRIVAGGPRFDGC
jgi:hypothetical protein